MIGPNGCGKSTLFKMIAGEDKPDKGTITVGETVQLMYVTQDRMGLDSDKSVFDSINDGYDVMDLGQREMNVRQYLSWYQFKGAAQQKKVGDLSGGERNRLQLAMTLKENGNLLLLDEPTNDLDVDTLRSLEDALLAFAGCAVVISHDRYFLDRVATHILAFEGEECTPFFWEGNFQSYEENKLKRLGEFAGSPDLPSLASYTSTSSAACWVLGFALSFKGLGFGVSVLRFSFAVGD